MRRLAVLLCLLLAGCNLVETRPTPSGPSFVVVTIDTLRADHVGAYGAESAETPTLDALAARGVRFETAVATAPLTLPAHTSMLTGLYPPKHGVRHNGVFRVSPETPTLAAQLQRAGWQTGAVLGAAVLDAEYGLARGFDHYDDLASGLDRKASASGYPERRAREVTDRAIAWLDEVSGPYLLWVHYYDPHAAYTPPEPFASRFAGRPYDGEIAYVDQELGRLLEAVGTVDAHEPFVLVTSDHGEGLGEHGEHDHSYLVYDADLLVPWIVAGPGLAPRVERGVVSHASLAPTVLALAGQPLPEILDAPDLSGVLRGTARVEPAWAYAESLAGRLDHGWGALHAIRTRTHHYIQAPKDELYDLARDPGQLANLLEEEGSVPEDALEDVREKMASVLADEAPLTTVEVDEEQRARIEALGYVVPRELPPESAVNPRDALPYANLSFLAMGDLHRGDAALAYARASDFLERFPESFRMNDLAARAALAMGRLDDALRHAERGTVLLPDHDAPWALLGAVQVRRGEPAAARRAYQRGLEIDPDSVDAGLGLFALSPTPVPPGLQTLGESLLARDDLGAEAYGQLAASWEGVGDDDGALAALERGLALHPDALPLRQALAVQWARRGEDRRAAEAWRRVAPEEREPAFEVRLAVAYAARGKTARAEGVLEDLLERRPEDEGARRLLARIQREALPGGAAQP